MILQGVDYGRVWGAAGVQGYFGEGWWPHKIPFRKPDFFGMTFVSKTITLNPVIGNMTYPWWNVYRKINPHCIKVNFLNGTALNSIGLTNMGLQAALDDGRWQKIEEPFVISLMSLASSVEEQLAEFRMMLEMLLGRMSEFKSIFMIQYNLSCPNTEHDPREQIALSEKILDVAGEFPMFTVMLKYSIATAPILAVAELEQHPHCHALCFSNTLPFGWEGVDWKYVWGSTTSPLEKIGGGGLSGKPLHPLVCEYLHRLRAAGFTKPINQGGGISSLANVHESINDVRSQSVFLGTIALTEPHQVAKIINLANSMVI